MRPLLFLAAALGVPLVLAACAAGGPALPSYGQEMKNLEAECAARQGILTPSGLQTGRPRADYVCKITGGASRIP